MVGMERTNVGPCQDSQGMHDHRPEEVIDRMLCTFMGLHPFGPQVEQL